MQLKSDVNKQGWEGGEFPVACETCMGDNPYVRMIKEPHGKACKICERPFTVFKWRPGNNARYKSTQVCQACAKMKNVCQICVLDLQYGLPVQVRDQLLKRGGPQATPGGTDMPQSDVSLQWMIQQQGRALENGGALDQAPMNQDLMRLARKQPLYRRNLPHKCSFYARGECNRGDQCPFRHEMPTDKKDPLAKQNIRDRFFGNNDPVANKILNGGGSSAAPLQPPADPGIKTLWVGGLTEVLGQEELKAALESFGEIQSVRLIATKGCAFIEFQDRSGAEKAARILNGNMNVKGIPLRLRWAMGERIDQPGLRNMGSTESFPSTGYVLPPPPGIAQGQSVPVMPQLKGYNPPPRPASNSLAPQSGYLPVPGPSTLTPVRRVHGTARQAVAPYPSQNPLRMGSKPRAGAEVEK